MRNVADMLEAFAAAKVVPGDKAREAMFAAIVREATRATPKAIAEVLHGLGSARGVGAGELLPCSPRLSCEQGGLRIRSLPLNREPLPARLQLAS